MENYENVLLSTYSFYVWTLLNELEVYVLKVLKVVVTTFMEMCF